MIETESDIVVRSDGRWFFREAEISNPAILRYFRDNLTRNGGRYYIENRFGERVEHSYLTAVEGFPLHVISLGVTPGPGPRWQATLDCDAVRYAALDELYVIDEFTLALRLPDGVPARLSPLAMAELGERIAAADPLELEVNGTRLKPRQSTMADLLAGVQSD